MTNESSVTDPVAADLPVRGWRSAFPPRGGCCQSISLDGSVNDAVAGATLAAYGIPVSLAYATLAGLPPEYGIYGYLVGGLFYALFGSSRQLRDRPDSRRSRDAGRRHRSGDGRRRSPERWALDSGAHGPCCNRLAHVCGNPAAWLLRLSSLVNFISETILLGFKAGAAC